MYISLITLCATLDMLFLGAAFSGIEKKMYSSALLLFLLACIPTFMIVFLYRKYKSKDQVKETSQQGKETENSPNINTRKILSTVIFLAMIAVSCYGWAQYLILKEQLPGINSAYYSAGYEDGASDTKKQYAWPGNITREDLIPVCIASWSAEKYHREACRYLGDDKITISLSKALENGFAPCSVCNPPV